MTVRELMILDEEFYSDLAGEAVRGLKKLKLGFRLEELQPSNSQIIDSIIFNQIVLANTVLSANDCIRVPEWTNQKEFDRFIAKIYVICK